MEITYESIASLIAERDEQGGVIKVTFVCPRTGTRVQSQAGLRRATDTSGRLRIAARSSLTASLRRAVGNAVRGVLGQGEPDAGAPDAGTADAATSYSEAIKQAAIVDAFEAVQHNFMWDPDGKTWISAEAALELITEFARQLHDGPIEKSYDRGVLARMMVEIANADGRLVDEEKEFLEAFLTPDLGSVDELSAKPPLGDAELAETSSGTVRDTMLMLAWALAFCDEDLDQREADRVQQLADGLGLGPNLVAELRGFAQHYVIDHALDVAHAGGARDPGRFAEAKHLADKIGLPHTEFERAETRWRKRKGIG